MVHNVRAARAHGIPHALVEAGVRVFADKGYQGASRGVSVPCRSRRTEPEAGRYLPLSGNQRRVNPAHVRLRARRTSQRPTQDLEDPAPAPLSPSDATSIVNAVQVLILNA
jgi:hypothetical protein